MSRKALVAFGFLGLLVAGPAVAGAMVCGTGYTTVAGGAKVAQEVCWWDELAWDGSSPGGGGGGGGGPGGGGGGGGGGGMGTGYIPTTVGLGGFDTNGDLKMDCWKNVTGVAPTAAQNGTGTPGTTAVSSPYGSAPNRPNDWHFGTDYISTVGVNYGEGQSVHAIANSIVIQTGYTETNGNYVKIQHFDGRASYYLHLKTISVSVGDALTAGRVVGTMNCTGNCSSGGVRGAQQGTHVHVELRTNPQDGRDEDQHTTTLDSQQYNNNCPAN